MEYQSSSDIVKAKTYDALQLQIWSLLPGFCIRPTDLVTSFKGIARILGSAITDREDLRSDVMAALRKLINQNLENGQSTWFSGNGSKSGIHIGCGQNSLLSFLPVKKTLLSKTSVFCLFKESMVRGAWRFMCLIKNQGTLWCTYDHTLKAKACILH